MQHVFDKKKDNTTYQKCCLVLMLVFCLTLTGCVGMEIEDGAKVYRTNLTGYVIQYSISIVLLVIGYCCIHGFVRPYGGLKKHQVPKSERFTTKVLLSILGMGIACWVGAFGLFATTFVVGRRDNVKLYPDRIEIVNSEAHQKHGPLVVPFSKLTSMSEATEDVGFGRRGRRTRTYFLFHMNDNQTAKVEYSRFLQFAMEDIEAALAEYRKNPGVVDLAVAGTNPTSPLSASTASGTPAGLAGSSPPDKQLLNDRIRGVQRRAGTSTTPSNAGSKTYSFKRYPIHSAIPSGHQVVTLQDSFDVGDKLKANYSGSWYPVTIVDFGDEGSIVCNWDDFSAFTYRMSREDLITDLGQSTGAEVESPFEESPFEEVPPPAVRPNPEPEYSMKRYPISSPLPQGYKRVLPATEVKVGQKLKANYANDWEFVTVEAINSDGTITCSWDNWKGFVYKMVREDLVIKR